jgi:hypothetical protein
MTYRLDGYMLEVCDCNVLCPCWIGEDPDGGTCEGVLAWHIESGTIDGVDVSGHTYAALASLPGNALEGNWKVLGVIDDGASEEQFEAIFKAFSGSLGGPCADLSGLVGEVVGVVRAPITADASEGSGTLTIGDLVSAEFTAYQAPFGQATNLQASAFSTHPGAPAYISKSSSFVRNTSQFGIPDVNIDGRNAVQAIFHFEV